MPPARPTAAEEAAFMRDLLDGIDESIFDCVPSPDQPRRRAPTPSKTRIQLSPVRCTARTPKKHGRVATPKNTRTPTRAKENEQQEIAALLEGVEDWDWSDMHADFMTPKKPSPLKHKNVKKTIGKLELEAAAELPQWQPEPCTRCVVQQVSYGGYTYKELHVSTEPGEETRKIILQDDWAATQVKAGDIVNVIGRWTEDSPSSSSCKPTPTITLTSAPTSPLLIHHPDILVTATALSSTPTCLRRPLLNLLCRSATDVTPALVWGNMLHEVMQTCLREGRWDEPRIDARIEEVARANLGDLMRLNVDVDEAKREVWARAGGLKTFAARYMSDTPKDSGILTNTRAERGQSSLLAIAGLHDIEEDIWSPAYGLKGKVDASVQAVVADIEDATNPFTAAKPTRRTAAHPAPLEIKTGRAVAGMEHRAQTMLYTLLMAERYGAEVPSGLLFYTQSEEVVRVPTVRNEVRALMMRRNELAGWIMRRIRQGEAKKAEVEVEEAFLPPTIDDPRICGKCFSVDTCMLYRKAVEQVEDEDSPIADIYELKTSHISQTHADFFKKWEHLIGLEEHDVVRFRKELWTMRADERERCGRAFADMALDTSFKLSDVRTPPSKDAKIHSYTYRFTKHAATPTPHSGSLLNGQMNVGDAVTVSVEPTLLAFAKGYIVELTPTHVVLGVDHALDAAALRTRLRPAPPALVFRIDRDELGGGMARIRDNLAQLFYADGHARLRALVVDAAPPRFGDLLGFVPDAAKAIIAALNANQQEAVRRVLLAEDYALILGMPGTGKTTVIAALIQCLVLLGKTVLLTSYTHSAVDNILLKLKDKVDFRILRLGNVDKVHPDVKELTVGARDPPRTIEQQENWVMSPPVVATTCLTIDHPLFSRRKFDYCIVDEASQVTLPTCLGPLRFADRFVLVGDHFQLPPLVRNRQAKAQGLDVSLFRMLSEARPETVVDLNEQYRMNADIMLLSNKLIYGDRLRCGSEEVARRGLKVDKAWLDAAHDEHATCKAGCWIDQLLDESCKAVFVDTDAVPGLESRVGDLTQNTVEAELVASFVAALVRSGTAPRQIGVLSLYRQQIKLLAYLLRGHAGVEILTADRSQGRDKDVIVISMVRSNDAGQLGDLLRDWRRINVSFTRARCKLVIVGSRRTLAATPLLAEFFKLMDGQGWILALPPGADTLHEELLAVDAETSLKRSADDEDPPAKRARRNGVNEEAFMRGRPILKDLMNDTQ
ncbi:DNA replication ATP-dependent helicase/nuclease DNA2 [Phanerochaete sordida]|uniref:DNA replication ATP-dependent helicase/nuclease DNA2 n=1 Tax=Phanerochaete sordida TaxID=48140 RepID=A0A9P3LFU7_9APHY|nr:DNA replication ATP-dependent helicase/nuclease DNA2 [Phanerochaete sordida]